MDDNGNQFELSAGSSNYKIPFQNIIETHEYKYNNRISSVNNVFA